MSDKYNFHSMENVFFGRVFEHFNGLYRFQGLRRYKEKFKPDWEPRFLVYRKHHSLWLSMLKVMRVIRKKK